VSDYLSSTDPEVFRIEPPRFPNLALWLKALGFHKRHWSDVVVIFPFLFVPIFVDTLQAILVRQEMSTKGQISVSTAMNEAARHTLDVFLLKLYFEFAAALWGYLPVYGWFRDYRHRVNWAMVSNVVTFEGLAGPVGRLRCVEVANKIPLDRAARILVTIPSLMIILFVAIIGVATYAFDTSFFFWLFGFIILWTVFPWAAVVNTYLYLSIPGIQGRALRGSQPGRALLDPHHYCPRCGHYEHLQGRCRRLSMAVNAYPGQFRKRCNAQYFLQSELLPSRVVCPTCSAELELEDEERSSFVFSCPECTSRTDWSARDT
jgi:predicted RNA-binding Zn-ribbon protein involved in translation (DUF1610 family)